jgi:hypothetical protein
MELKIDIQIPNNTKRIADCNVGDILRFNNKNVDPSWTYIYAGKYREEHFGIVLHNGLSPVGSVVSICGGNDDILMRVIGTAKFTYNP